MQTNIQSVVNTNVDVDDEADADADACADVNADDADMALNEKIPEVRWQKQG